MAEIRPCVWCRNPLKHFQVKFCCIDCRDAYQRRVKQELNNFHHKGTREKMVPYTPKKKKVLITDSEQKALNKRVDDKHNMKLEYRSIKPGHPEFEKIAKQITPLDRIQKVGYNPDCLEI